MLSIPKGWQSLTIEDACTLSSGTTPARDQYDRYYKNGTVHWVKTLDLNNSVLRSTEECVTEKALEETSLKVYPPGTVLVAMYGGYNQIGRTGLLEISAAVNQAITALQPAPSKINSSYLLAYLNYKIDYWKTVASSSRKDPNITSADVRTFPIVCPPIEEQRAIASALSDMDALLAKLDQLIAKKRDIKQAAMQELLTGRRRLPGFSGKWDSRSIGNDIDLLTGFPFPSNLYCRTGIRLLRGSNVKRGQTDWNEEITQYWPGVNSEISRYELQDGDLVIAMDGSLVGRSYARIGKADLPALLLQRVARIRSTSRIDAGYLAALVGSD
jgi:type I restriction enzyme S subunit